MPCFRLYARAVALEWGVAALAAKIELIVSERLTNGIRISQRSPGDVTAAVVRLWLTTDLHCVLIRVWDGSGQMPVRRNVKTDEESGRGLMLVEYVASERGSYRVEDGKVVWAVVG